MGYIVGVEPERDDDELVEQLFDALLMSDESQRLLEQLALQALAEYAAGETLDLDELLETLRNDEPCE